jgi:hypothetical protein
MKMYIQSHLKNMQININNDVPHCCTIRIVGETTYYYQVHFTYLDVHS